MPTSYTIAQFPLPPKAPIGIILQECQGHGYSNWIVAMSTANDKGGRKKAFITVEVTGTPKSWIDSMPLVVGLVASVISRHLVAKPRSVRKR